MQSRSIEMARRYQVKIRVASSHPEHRDDFTEIGPEKETKKIKSTNKIIGETISSAMVI
jgi:aspartokinase